MRFTFLILLAFAVFACSSDAGIGDSPEEVEKLYFPPANDEKWESKTSESMGWNSGAIDELYDFLSDNDTRAFLLLSEGKIVLEKYWGTSIQDDTPFNQNSVWYWASAGKTLTAFLCGIAQEKGLLNINDRTADYLGASWTSSSKEKEDLILIRHQLSMTTGLDYTVANTDCTSPECLQYKADAGSEWFYHNAPYSLLEKVISTASGQSYNNFTRQNIELQIGMNGSWIKLSDNNVYWSTARDAARFGLLLLNKGKWANTEVLEDKAYFTAMTSSSQTLNPSYGFCTWLNGKSSIILPGLPTTFNIPLSKNAPSDLFAAMGKNGQFIEVVPQKKLVVVRMGEAPNSSMVPIVFHNDMWEKINALMDTNR